MRGQPEKQALMLSALTSEQLVPQDHPIRQIKPIVDRVLTELSSVFNQMYAQVGHPSIPPEHLLKGCLLIALYSIRSERQSGERLQYDLLFKWFLDLNIMGQAFDPSTFPENKARLLEHQMSRQFFSAVLAQSKGQKLLSEEHFTVDGTLLEAWASLKSFRPRGSGSPVPGDGGRNPRVDFRGEQHRHQTHTATTDPEARLAHKGPGKEAKLCFVGYVLMENHHGLVVEVMLIPGHGYGGT